jgi:hypothetical protein
MKLFKLIFTVLLFFSISSLSLVAQCSGGTSGGALAPAPTASFQTNTVQGGKYYTFTVPAFTACTTYTYTFSFCAADGGNASYDTQITILDNSGTYAGGYNDDNCSLQSRLVWIAPAPGTYRVLVNQYSCTTGGNITLAYKRTTNSGLSGPYCLTDDAIPLAVPGYSNCAQMTAETNDQRGCIWNTGTISFATAFDYTVMMYFGNNVSGADGCTFSFQNNPAGISTCGAAGGQLGMGGVSNAVVIEYDTYDNDNPMHVYDMSADHTAIEVDGNLQGPGAPLCGPVQANPISTTIDDGAIHAIRVTWNPVTMNLSTYFDGTLRLSCVYNYVLNVFGGNPNVYWGFTGATGGLNNQQYFCPVNLPLPINLVDITANCNNGYVNLDWITATEINNSHFEIERSYNAIDYEFAGRINGSGNSNQTLHYQFTDTILQQGTVYYRLKQVDFNGDFNLFNPVFTNCSGTNNGGLDINYVLTTNYGLLLDFTTQTLGSHTIKVFDMTGNLMVQYASEFSTGSHQQSLLIPQLSSGIYAVVIENAENTRSKKISYLSMQ